jgi:hypothetical protein
MAINVNLPSNVVRNCGCQAKGDNSLPAVRRHSDYHRQGRNRWAKGQGSTNGSHRDNSMPFMWRSATVGSAKDDVKRALRRGQLPNPMYGTRQSQLARFPEEITWCRRWME